MKVIIDDQVYVPACSHNSGDATAKAIIRALVSGWYTEPECHVTGGSPKKHCACPACHLRRMADMFIGGDLSKSEAETEPGFLALWEATDK